MLTTDDLNKLEVALRELHALRTGDRDQLEGEALSATESQADEAVDSYNREVNIDLLEGEEEEIREINAALERLADQSYGLCETCHGEISLARLYARPQARHCARCEKRVKQE